jgi:hypothetical protein
MKREGGTIASSPAPCNRKTAAAEIRNPNVEIRNKLEIRTRKPETLASSFSAWGFGFVSDFEIRISDFVHETGLP